jgi:hypothetical protein
MRPVKIKFAALHGLCLMLVAAGAGPACREKFSPPRPQGPNSYIERGEPIFAQRHLPLAKNEWVRDAENLRVLHETLKFVGYRRLAERFAFEFDDQLVTAQFYSRRSGRAILEDLFACEMRNECGDYARGFFARRARDDTLAVSRAIIREVGRILLLGEAVPVRERYVHPVLAELLRIEFPKRPPDAETARGQIRFLLRHGFHQSAYNLLYERGEFIELDLDRATLAAEFERTAESLPAWFEDDSK